MIQKIVLATLLGSLSLLSPQFSAAAATSPEVEAKEEAQDTWSDPEHEVVTESGDSGSAPLMAADCASRLQDAENDPAIQRVKELVASWCRLAPNPRFRELPSASCCMPSDMGCSGGQCASYDVARHKICICSGPSCNSTPEALRQNLWEEYWHALQNCMRQVNPIDHPPPAIDCDTLTVPVGPGTFRCCQLDSGMKNGPKAWCNEINAKCNNPFDDTPMKPDDCSSFCGAYGDASKACCRKTCEDYFDACCNWIGPETLPVAPTPTPKPSATPKASGANQSSIGSVGGVREW